MEWRFQNLHHLDSGMGLQFGVFESFPQSIICQMRMYCSLWVKINTLVKCHMMYKDCGCILFAYACGRQSHDHLATWESSFWDRGNLSSNSLCHESLSLLIHGSQIWLQLSAASPRNRLQAKVKITKVIIKLIRCGRLQVVRPKLGLN